MSGLGKFYAAEAGIMTTEEGLVAVRSGVRVILQEDVGDHSLSKHISGKFPYYYRKIDSILKDFSSEHNALENIVDLMATAPKGQSFRNSHCGEILAAEYLKEKFGYKILYSKLTMTTSEDTNAHKMDALMVDTSSVPYKYVFVEAKSSVAKNPPKKAYHRSGLMKRMIDFLETYKSGEPRFEFIRIRENLSKDFSENESQIIQKDFRMPGPDIKFLGVSVTNKCTIDPEDDDYILTDRPPVEFDYHAIAITDLEILASKAYGIWDDVISAAGQ